MMDADPPENPDKSAFTKCPAEYTLTVVEFGGAPVTLLN
jgi:hypothetical protein